MSTVNKNHLSMDPDSLIKVQNVDLFVSATLISLCDFYNGDGGIILMSARSVPSSVRNRPVFVKKAAYDAIVPSETSTLEVMGEVKPKDPPVSGIVPKVMTDAEVHKKAEETYGQPVVKITNQALDGVEELLATEKMTKKTLRQAEEIVEETFKHDKGPILGCVTALQKVDAYTYAHSFGVYLLFSQALEDFKALSDKPAFYDVFKNLNAKVNFNTASIKKYATAALLHDFGKRKIPSEILMKNAKLTDEEYAVVKHHPSLAIKEMCDLGFDDMTFLEIIGNHHREYLTFPQNGQGPLAQICNIVDIYEACQAKRPYKEPMSYNMVQNILLSEKQKKHVVGWDSFLFVTLLKTTLPKFEEKRIL